MGVNNKRRRAAKKRKRARQGSAGGTSQQHHWGDGAADPGWAGAAAYGLVELRVTSTIRRLSRRKVEHPELLRRAESLLRAVHPQPGYLVGEVLGDVLGRLSQGVVEGGWDLPDLEQLVRRCADQRHLPTLSALLDEGTRLRLDTTEQLASGLQVGAVLASAPLLDADAASQRLRRGTARTTRTSAHPKLAQVRALLAKAESTDYDEEAEALSAKAQELITRYALGRLLKADDGDVTSSAEGPSVRRLWLDAPYVRAKAALVHEVADANRCRSASADRLGFCVVVGSEADLDGVELLVTSLLVQANSAMLRHGRRLDAAGTSRTRSFRQSFLVAYAARIGERLRAATTGAVASQDPERLLPVLHDHETRVTEAFDAVVPHTVGKATSVTDGEGWAAGLAAADLALLDVNGNLPEAERAG